MFASAFSCINHQVDVITTMLRCTGIFQNITLSQSYIYSNLPSLYNLP